MCTFLYVTFQRSETKVIKHPELDHWMNNVASQIYYGKYRGRRDPRSFRFASPRVNISRRETDADARSTTLITSRLVVYSEKGEQERKKEKKGERKQNY